MIPELIALRLGLPLSFLVKLSTTASHRYKEFEIPKRAGNGTRKIHHPARELKLVQNWLLENVLTVLPVHAAATAYKNGSSIRRNAEKHVSNNYLLRIDFQNFFPSLKGRDVDAILRANQKLSQLLQTTQDVDFIRRIVCRFDALSIGAPTSPHLSNAIMFKFDEAMTDVGNRSDVQYTRYADDLYFSTNRPNVLRGILDTVRQFLATMNSPQLRINDRKTAFSSRKRRRLAAGLVLTSDKKVSIGRDKKRMLKSMVLRLKFHDLRPKQIASLRGWISYVRSVEPEFIRSLETKYELDFTTPSIWDF